MRISSFILPIYGVVATAQEVKPISPTSFQTSILPRPATSTATTTPDLFRDTTKADYSIPAPEPSVSSKTASSSDYTRCATHPNEGQRALLDILPTNKTYTYKAQRQVGVYIHIITTEAKRNSYTQQMIQDQITVLNDAYSPTGFTFNLLGSDFTVQDSWAQATAGSDEESQMKAALHMGSYSDLNLYFLSDLADGILGFCYFPTSSPSRDTLILDGCVMLAASLPNSTAENYNMGITAVHEVGHWFALYHVFEGNSCSGNGDFLSDTPMQKTATFGCPTTKQDSCPGKDGVDSIHNYLDYSYDQCLYEFTDGQAQRARALFDEYRAGN